MNHFLIFVLCMLCVQAESRSPPVEEDVETSTHYDIRPPPPNFVGFSHITNPRRLKELQKEYGDEIEEIYNIVFNKKDSNYSFLAKVRYATQVVVPCKLTAKFLPDI